MPVQFFSRKESVEAIPLDTPLEMLFTEVLKHLVPDIIFFTSNIKTTFLRYFGIQIYYIT